VEFKDKCEVEEQRGRKKKKTNGFTFRLKPSHGTGIVYEKFCGNGFERF